MPVVMRYECCPGSLPCHPVQPSDNYYRSIHSRVSFAQTQMPAEARFNLHQGCFNHSTPMITHFLFLNLIIPAQMRVGHSMVLLKVVVRPVLRPPCGGMNERPDLTSWIQAVSLKGIAFGKRADAARFTIAR